VPQAPGELFADDALAWGGHPASADYHRYHLVLLKKLAATRPEALWANVARRWQSPC
jgi:hypothetical protein